MPSATLETPVAPDETEETVGPEPPDEEQGTPDEGEAVPAEDDEETPGNAKAEGQEPTLREAFDALARALVPLLEDNVPAQVQLHEARAMHEDGNVELPWRLLVATLEDVLGVSLRR